MAVIKDVTRTVDSFPEVAKIQSPLDAAHQDQISDDEHGVMVTFQPKGTFEEASLYIDKIDAAVDKAQQRHPDFYVDEMGSVSTTKATDAAFNSMLAKAGLISIPLTLLILLLVFGSLTAALIPLLLALTVGLRDDGPDRVPELDRSDGRERERSHPVDRSGRRRGLRALLRQARA